MKRVFGGLRPFDITTTSCELFDAERPVAVVAMLNAHAGPTGPVAIELYSTRRSPLTPLKRIVRWERRYDARAVRVHIEFVYNRAELREIIQRVGRHAGCTAGCCGVLCTRSCRPQTAATGPASPGVPALG
jgi:hypothetical protein